MERVWGDSAILFNVVDGVIRVGLFVGYIWLIGRSKEIRRVFAYHGAEHKTIWAYEAGDPLTLESIHLQPPPSPLRHQLPDDRGAHRPHRLHHGGPPCLARG